MDAPAASQSVAAVAQIVEPDLGWEPGSRALPEPTRGGSLDRLGDFINVSGADLKLVIA